MYPFTYYYFFIIIIQIWGYKQLLLRMRRFSDQTTAVDLSLGNLNFILIFNFI